MDTDREHSSQWHYIGSLLSHLAKCIRTKIYNLPRILYHTECTLKSQTGGISKRFANFQTICKQIMENFNVFNFFLMLFLKLHNDRRRRVLISDMLIYYVTFSLLRDGFKF